MIPSSTLIFLAGEWSPSPSGVSHQEEVGLSPEGVSYRRQGRLRQLQHQSSAEGHAPGPAEEPSPGTGGTVIYENEEKRIPHPHSQPHTKRPLHMWCVM